MLSRRCLSVFLVVSSFVTMGDSGLCVFDAITSNISRSTLIVHGSCAAPSGSNHCKSISMPPCIASRTMRRPAQIGQPAGSVADIRQSLQVPMEDSLAHLDSVKRLEQLLKDKTLEKEIAQDFEYVQSDQRNVSISDKDRGADIVISIGNAELPSVATIKVTINVDGSEDGQPNALRESGLHKLQFEVDGEGNPTKGAVEIAKNFGRDR